MGFADKMKKGLGDVTRVGSDDLDKRRQEEKAEEYAEEIAIIKKDIGDAIFISYAKGEPVDERFTSQCEKIKSLIGQMNEAASKK